MTLCKRAIGSINYKKNQFLNDHIVNEIGTEFHGSFNNFFIFV